MREMTTKMTRKPHKSLKNSPFCDILYISKKYIINVGFLKKEDKKT